jgi:hypothetical protein
MPTIAIQNQGVFITEGGPEALLGHPCACVRIDPGTGMVTVRIPASQVEVREEYGGVAENTDMTNEEMVRIAVQFGGLTLARLAQANPSLAAQLQAEGIVPGDNP